MKEPPARIPTWRRGPAPYTLVMRTEVGGDIEKAAALLSAGDLVAIPTETVYGLAANALDPRAVANIFDVKNRPRFDPLIVHLGAGSGPESPMAGMTNAAPEADGTAVTYLRRLLEKYAATVPDWALALGRRFWPGPLTLVLPRTPLIPDIVTSGLGSVGLRIPAHPMTLELLGKLAFPLAAPSANPFGYVSPTTAQHVLDQLGGKIAYVLDGGPCKVGLESTIVGEQAGRPQVLRLGGLRVDDIEGLIGPISVHIQSSSRPQNPGSLESHYAPSTRVFFDDLGYRKMGFNPAEIAMLLFRKSYPGVPRDQQRVLSTSGDLREAAQNLFSALRELDELCRSRNLRAIFAQKVPESGLGLAINDRLRRASS